MLALDPVLPPPVGFVDHSTVTLARDVTADGRVLPAGASGTVMSIGNGTPRNFEIAFDKPFVSTVTLSGVDLTV